MGQKRDSFSPYITMVMYENEFIIFPDSNYKEKFFEELKKMSNWIITIQ